MKNYRLTWRFPGALGLALMVAACQSPTGPAGTDPSDPGATTPGAKTPAAPGNTGPWTMPAGQPAANLKAVPVASGAQVTITVSASDSAELAGTKLEVLA